MDYQKGTYVLVSDTQLRDPLIAWAAKELLTPTAKARIIRNDPDYADSLFLEVEADDPLDQGAFNAVFKRHDPEGVFNPGAELNRDGTYSLLPESVSLSILTELIGEQTGFAAKKLLSYHSVELDGVLCLSM